jgi:hypothetical protein
MTTSSHDKLFKDAFGEPTRAAQQLRSVVPPTIVQHLRDARTRDRLLTALRSR